MKLSAFFMVLAPTSVGYMSFHFQKLSNSAAVPYQHELTIGAWSVTCFLKYSLLLLAVLIVASHTNCARHLDLHALNVSCEQRPSPYNNTPLDLGFALFPKDAVSSSPLNTSLPSPSPPHSYSKPLRSTTISLGASLGFVLLLCFALSILLWTYRRRVRTVEGQFKKFLQDEPKGRSEEPCQYCAHRIEVPGKEMIRVAEIDGQGLSEAEEKRALDDSALGSMTSGHTE